MSCVLQGSSVLTPRKEFEIEGITAMRLNQFKCKWFNYDTVILADVFSGTGTNVIGSERVDGSPIRLIRAMRKYENTNDIQMKFWFSDNRQSACDSLNKLSHAMFGVSVDAKKMEAKDAVEVLSEYVDRNSGAFLYLVLDPNGPKDFPRDAVENLLRCCSKKVDVLPYISATAISRCIGASRSGLSYRSWLGGIENFDEGFVRSLTLGRRGGWIRKPVLGDAWRWTMLPTFGCLIPRNDWSKQDYVQLNTEEGQRAVRFYCGRYANE